MRYAADHKRDVRDRIIHAAAARLRSEGLDATSVPQLMKDAGLTHGGFYGYFKSRDDLVAAAVLSAARQTSGSAFKSQADLDAMLNGYLSEGHLDHPESGCVVAALGSDGWRKRKPVRTMFSHVAAGLVKFVDQKIRKRSEADVVSDRALAVTAQMVGTVILGRLFSDPVLRRRMLHAGREAAKKL